MILDEIVADKREQLFRDKQKTDLTVMRTLAEEKLREEAAKKEKIRSIRDDINIQIRRSQRQFFGQ